MTDTAVGRVRREQPEFLPEPRPRLPRWSRTAQLLLVLLTGVTLLLGYANKARCVGPEFDAAGRSGPDYDDRVDRDVCYSDIQELWLGRDIDQPVFPYLTGSINPEGRLIGGSVEYPVLTGLLIWAGAAFATNDGQFLLASALLMTPFGLLTGWMLGRLARWRALVWALGPPLAARCTSCTARCASARWPTGPHWPRCCSGWASRSSCTRGRSWRRSRCTCSPRPGREPWTGAGRCGWRWLRR